MSGLFSLADDSLQVNMPAKAVVFNSIRKHDGTQFRVLEPGEYTQMAGRKWKRRRLRRNDSQSITF